MAKLGFLGLGIMGYPMARNLLQAGHDVGLWSHTADKADELADAAADGSARLRQRRRGRRMRIPVRRRQRDVRKSDPRAERDSSKARRQGR